MDRYDQYEMDPWIGGIRSIGSTLAQMPSIRARGALMRAQADTEAAQAEHYRAGSRKLDAETAATQDETASSQRLSDALRRVALNPKDTNSIGDVFEAYGRNFKKNPNEAAAGLGKIMSQFLAMQGSTNVPQMAELQGDAANVYKTDQDNATRKQIEQQKPPGGTRGTGSRSTPQFTGMTLRLPSDQKAILSGDVPMGKDGKPIAPIQMPSQLARSMRDVATGLRDEGMSESEALILAPKLVLGEAPTLQPNVTGTPGMGARSDLRTKTELPAMPPSFTTNSFTVVPSGDRFQIAQQLLESTRSPGMTNLIQRLAPQAVAAGGPQVPPQGTARAKPTRAIAAQYVQQLGREGALKRLSAEGYDISGYAD